MKSNYKIEMISLEKIEIKTDISVNDEIKNLISSIKKIGLIEPIAVRKVDEKFQIISGNIRAYAMKTLNEKFIPAIVFEMTDEEAAELFLQSNSTMRGVII